VLSVTAFGVSGCTPSRAAPAQTPQPYYPPQGPQPYPPQGPQPYPPQGPQPYASQGPQAPQARPWQPGPTAPAPGPAAPAAGPLLAPLIGVPMQQQEVRQILAELINALGPQNRAKVLNIPMTFDPTPEVNAFAGCDERGQAFMAATAGILEAVDAIAQTRATDELFGTKTYDAYCTAVLPRLAREENARAGLPAGIIPTNLGPDLRRWSRAREIFQEVMAFTMGHELAHHYLGHTGCANGQPPSGAPDPAMLGRLLTRVPTFNQVAEAAADSSGILDVLSAGRARRSQNAWSENGGVFLLDFFARLETAAGGGGPLTLLSPVQVLRTHPNPLARMPLVRAVAQTWRVQNPG
jgi:hypothetical protein